MTKQLEQAFAKAARLPKREQDALAEWLLLELEDERRWKKAFKASRKTLGELADEALAELREGKTRPLDPDEL
jgi:hypothetical protein